MEELSMTFWRTNYKGYGISAKQIMGFQEAVIRKNGLVVKYLMCHDGVEAAMEKAKKYIDSLE